MTEDLAKWLSPLNNPLVLAEKMDEALKSNINISKRLLDKFNEEHVYKMFKKLIKD